MKLIKLAIVVSLIGVCTFAQNLRKLPYHPFRRVGSHYYDLTPVYEWLGISPDGRDKYLPRPADRPMPDWVGGPDPRAAALNLLIITKVLQIEEGGLLVETRSIALATGNESSRVSFLINYPYAKTVVDGQQIEFLAMRTGRFTYTNTLGSVSTVPMLDYGVPYNPWAKAAERARK